MLVEACEALAGKVAQAASRWTCTKSISSLADENENEDENQAIVIHPFRRISVYALSAAFVQTYHIQYLSITYP